MIYENFSHLGQRWVGRDTQPIPDNLAELPYPPAIKRLLVARGLRTPEEIEAFLHADIHSLGDPFQIGGVDRAVERIALAIRNGEKIGVFGDYDVDGQAATSILLKTLAHLGAQAEPYIPNRLYEGYGLNVDALASLQQSGCTLVITVDCGITAFEEAKWAATNGLDLIITDHHEPSDELPQAVCVINPKLDNVPEVADLAGCGVAFKLAEALAQTLGPGRTFVHQYTDLVALGTVADLVPLVHENRALVRAGLALINEGKAAVGIRALCDVAGVKGPIRAGHIGYSLGPRLNAIGRIGEADAGLRLLMASSYEEALPLAEELDRANTHRQALESQVVEEAQTLIDELQMEQEKGIVLCQKGWHVGVVGIAASRLVETYYRPTVVLTVEGDKARGSARSIPGFDLYSALETCSDLFDSFGGHTGAAGLTLPLEHVESFRRRFAQVAAERLSDEDLRPLLEIDELVSPDEISLEWIETLSLLEPYGLGNPTPIFASANVWVEARAVGKDQEHLKFEIALSKNAKQRVDGIGFRLASQLSSHVSDAGFHDIAYTVEINEWQGRRKPSLRVKDLSTATASRRPAARLLQATLSMPKPPSAPSSPTAPSPSSLPLASMGNRNGTIRDKVALVQSLLNDKRRIVIFVGDASNVWPLAAELSEVDSQLKGAVFAWDERVIQTHPKQLEEVLASPPWIAVSHAPIPVGFQADEVVLWNLPLDPRSLAVFLDAAVPAGGESRLHLAFTPDDLQELRSEAMLSLPDRDQLRRVYVTVRELTEKRGGILAWEDVVTAVDERWPRLLSQDGIARALEIFAEVELLTFNNDKVIMPETSGGKVDLTRSLLYNECNLIRSQLWNDTELTSTHATFKPSLLVERMTSIARRLDDASVGQSAS